mgnify:CR=1 FL=1
MRFELAYILSKSFKRLLPLKIIIEFIIKYIKRVLYEKFVMVRNWIGFKFLINYEVWNLKLDFPTFSHKFQTFKIM